MITIQSLAESILLPFGSNDDMLVVEATKQRILAFRQVLIQQDYSRNLRINQQLVQAFDLELTEVEEGDDKFYISDILPKPIILSKELPFISVTTAFKGRTKKDLGYLTVEEIPYIKYRKFTSRANYFTYENDRIISYAPAKSLRVRAIWDNPIEAFKFAEKETFKLACSKDIISSPCSDGIDIVLEETMAARILSFFNNPRNANTDQEAVRERGDRGD